MFGRKHRADTGVDSRPWRLNFHIGFEDGDARCGKTTDVALLQTKMQLPSSEEIVDASTTAFTWARDQAVVLQDSLGSSTRQ